MKNKRFKILRIQSRICIGGPAIHTALLSAHLPKEQFETVLIGGAVDPGEFCKFEELQRSGIDIRIINDMQRKANPIKDLIALYKLYQIIKHEKPDIVHTHTAKAGALGRTAAILAGVPLIFHTFHGHTFANYFSFWVTEIFKFIERVLARFSTAIIAISPRQKYDLSRKYHIAPAKHIRVIYLGFDLQPFLSVQKNNYLKKQLGIGENEVLVGIIGRLVPIKNHSASLRILKSLHKKGALFHLCIVGDGPERIKIEEMANQYGLQEFVHFLGWEQDMASIYAGIDVMLLTSLNEGTPVTIIEAMASMTPVVSSSVGGVPDLVASGQNGFLYPLENEDKAVDYIREIVQTPGVKERLTISGKKFALENFMYTRLVDDIVSLYQEYLSKQI